MSTAATATLTLTPNAAELLAAIKRFGPITVDEVRCLTKITRPERRDNAAWELQKAGIITAEYRDGAVYYSEVGA